MRPFPEEEIVEITKNAKAVGVIDRDISFGYEGTVFTNVNSALLKGRGGCEERKLIAGLGGRDISKESIREAFHDLREVALGTSKKWLSF